MTRKTIYIANTDMAQVGKKRGKGHKVFRRDLERAAMDVLTCKYEDFDNCLCWVEEATDQELMEVIA